MKKFFSFLFVALFSVSMWAVDFYITGSAVGGWNANDVPVTGSSYTIENLAAGSYMMKVTVNGTWDGENNVYGYDALTAKIGGLTRGSGGDNDNICFTLSETSNVTVTFIQGSVFTVEGNFVMPTIQLAGSWNWESISNFTPSLDKLTASVKLNFTANYYEFKIIYNGTWKGKWIDNDDTKYYITRNVLSVNNFEEGKNNLVITPDVAGDYTFTYTYATGELVVSFPEIPAPTYYIAGDFTSWGTSKVEMAENEGVWNVSINIDTESEYQSFKVVKVIAKINPDETWYGLASWSAMTEANCTNWTIGGGEESIGITMTKKGLFTFKFTPATTKVSVEYPDATALDNTADEAKAIKRIENGQLVIYKNGVRYNALGAEIK